MFNSFVPPAKNDRKRERVAYIIYLKRVVGGKRKFAQDGINFETTFLMLCALCYARCRPMIPTLCCNIRKANAGPERTPFYSVILRTVRGAHCLFGWEMFLMLI